MVTGIWNLNDHFLASHSALMIYYGLIKTFPFSHHGMRETVDLQLNCYMLYIIHIHSHVVFSTMGPLACMIRKYVCRVRLCITKCTLSSAHILYAWFDHLIFSMCSRIIAVRQLMLFVDGKLLKIKLIVLHCIVSYSIVNNTKTVGLLQFSTLQRPELIIANKHEVFC